jgi:hypothetical protein
MRGTLLMITGTKWIPDAPIDISIGLTGTSNVTVPLGTVLANGKGIFTFTASYNEALGPQPYVVATSSAYTVKVFIYVIADVAPAPFPVPLRRGGYMWEE